MGTSFLGHTCANNDSWNNPAPGGIGVKVIYLGGEAVDSVSRRMATNATQPEESITKEQLAKRLSLSVADVKNLVYRRVILVLRLGHRTIRFRGSEVELATSATVKLRSVNQR